MHGFHAGQDLEDQPSYSYSLPMGDASADVLADIDDRISLSSCGTWSKMMSKLLPYPGVCICHYYCLGGEKVVCSQTLPLAITELGEMRSSNNLNEMDVVF